jgi:alkanesulfonate monooxygenase SsuD/methylene tetrahydromethanopterin reductase-like flavin-dependent oxidoreductase (luciferase family)
VTPPDGNGPRQRGFGVAAGLENPVAEQLAERCQALGYSSIWSNDHPMASGLETVARFAAGAPTLDLGVAVMALDRHTPEDIATRIESVGLDPARLWVGIGAGFTKRPLGVVRDGLGALRSALPDGTRVAVAAMGPKMCALAGAEADGVFLNWMTPDKAAWARERIWEGADSAGRDAPPIFAYVRVAVGTDAGDRLLKEESFYRGLHQGYIKHFEALDREPGTVGIAAADAPDVPSALAPYEKSVDHIVVRALAHADLEGLGVVADAAAPRAV